MEENTYLEFKRQYTDNIKKEIVSFLNAGGGKIIIGVDDEGRVVGVEDLDDCMLRIMRSSLKWEQIALIIYVRRV